MSTPPRHSPWGWGRGRNYSLMAELDHNKVFGGASPSPPLCPLLNTKPFNKHTVIRIYTIDNIKCNCLMHNLPFLQWQGHLEGREEGGGKGSVTQEIIFFVQREGSLIFFCVFTVYKHVVRPSQIIFCQKSSFFKATNFISGHLCVFSFHDILDI